MRQERNFSAVTAWVARGRTELPGRAGAGSVAQPSVISAQQLSLCVHDARGSVLGRAGHSLEDESPSPPGARGFFPPTGTASYCWACGFGLEPSLDRDTHASSDEAFLAWVPPHTFLCPFPFPGLCSLLLQRHPFLPNTWPSLSQLNCLRPHPLLTNCTSSRVSNTLIFREKLSS